MPPPSFPAMTDAIFLQAETVESRSVRNRPDCAGRVLSPAARRPRPDNEPRLAGLRRPTDRRCALTDSREGSAPS
jgi:hypothetical protein